MEDENDPIKDLPQWQKDILISLGHEPENEPVLNEDVSNVILFPISVRNE